MQRRTSAVVLATVCSISMMASTVLAQAPVKWLAHDMRRPRPPVVTPGKLNLPVSPPSDAVILFDGTDLSNWRDAEGGPAKWTAQDDYMESVPNSGYVYTAGVFGDVQLHVEWASPVPAKGKSQGRGNSGIFLMGLYEVQVLDSYENDTYPDGQAAAVYGQYPPLVNACLPPGEWQSYDIVFRRPRFHRDGRLDTPARITVIQNGVLVQDNVELWGPTSWIQHRPYKPHPDKLPIGLQDHGNPVRYRNIWLRELRESDTVAPPPVDAGPFVYLSAKQLEPYVGRYGSFLGEFGTIEVVNNVLQVQMDTGQVVDLVPRSETEFQMRYTASSVTFDVDEDGTVKGFTLELGERKYPVKKLKPKDEEKAEDREGTE